MQIAQTDTKYTTPPKSKILLVKVSTLAAKFQTVRLQIRSLTNHLQIQIKIMMMTMTKKAIVTIIIQTTIQIITMIQIRIMTIILPQMKAKIKTIMMMEMTTQPQQPQ